jgi:sodium-dependent dicarboxylate transporter 2/3/5
MFYDSLTGFLMGTKIGLMPEVSKNWGMGERLRRVISLFLGPALAVCVYFIPLEGLSASAHKLLSIFCLVIVWWIGEPISLGLTSLTIPFLIIITGIASPKEAFSEFSNPIIFLFLGSFIIAEGIRKHELDRYFAVKILRIAGRDSRAIVLLLCGFSWFSSFWLSNTAVTAMLLPLAYGVAKGVRERNFMCGLLLFMAYSASIGGISTPVGTPPNLITLGFFDTLLNYHMGFLKWMLIAIPMTFLTFLSTYLIMRLVYIKKKDIEEVQIVDTNKGLSRAQKNLLFVLGAVVFFWVVPGILQAFLKDENLKKVLSTRIHETIPAVGGAILLFLIPTNIKNLEFTLSPSIIKEIEWDTILLFGGGLTLGEMIIKTGLGGFLSDRFFSFMSHSNIFYVTLFFSIIGVLFTEVMSNTAATNMLIPLVISFCQKNGISPVMPSLATCYASSLAFFLPVSTPPNAIVYSSGYIRITEMMKVGLLCDIAGIIIINAWLSIGHYFHLI